ncbi:hypothetical protein RB597_001851 [Gaeumannomyces tritici]
MDLAFCGVARREDAAALEAKRERLLQSLTFPRMNERRSLVASSHPGTFRWVLQDGSDNDEARRDGETVQDGSDTDEASQDGETEGSGSKITWDSFVDWLRSTETTYWVSGKPGAGKTTLMKYLMAQPETQQHLRSWNTEAAVVISHLFWRPGNDMQQSIRGLQCSLLHQLFSESPLSTDWVLQGHESIRRKSADTDWSGEELTSTLYKVMSQYPSPVVIFLDGLDEVLPKDGTLQLLHFIEELRERYGKVGKLKLCLGSRREPLLLRRLAAYPQLRLEHLTLEDLRQYGHDKMVIPHDYQIIITPNLPFHPQSNHNSLREWLVAGLVEKAEGVFLWLCLTTTTLTDALHRGETLEDLWHRITSLPGDLLELYKDMWARTDIETPHRRRIAASYLRLALAGPYVWLEPLNIFHYMVATNGDAHKRLLELDIPTNAPANFLIQACKATRRELESTCAGFLQCPPPEKQVGPTDDDRNFILLPWHGKEYDGLVPYINQSRVFFLHRTAQDFLLDTAEGRQILNNDNDSLSGWDENLRLAQARLAECRLFKSPSAFLPPGCRTGPIGNMPYSIEDIICSAFSSKDLNTKHLTGDQTQLLLQCERAFNDGYITTPHTLPDDNIHMRRYPGLLFLVGFEEVVRRQNEYWILLGECDWLDFVAIWDMILKIVQDRNLDVRTQSELLISLCTLKRLRRDSRVDLDARLSAMRKLLHMGASATWSGSCPGKAEMDREEIIVVQTPIKALVSSIWADFCGFSTTQNDARLFLEFVQLLVAKGADLKEEVHIAIQFDIVSSGRCVLSPLAVFASEYEPHSVGQASGRTVTTLVLACPASTLIAIMVQIWEKANIPQLDELLQPGGVMERGFGTSRPIAVARIRPGERSSWSSEAYNLLRSPHVYPLPFDGSLDGTPLWLARFAEQSMKDGGMWTKNRTGGEYGELMVAEVSIPPDLELALYLLVKRLVLEKGPLLDRKRELRRRLGICTPCEEWGGRWADEEREEDEEDEEDEGYEGYEEV